MHVGRPYVFALAAVVITAAVLVAVANPFASAKQAAPPTRSLATTRATAMALLQRLAPPTGFERAGCEGPVYGYTNCFRRRSSVDLTSAEAAAWVRTLGIKVTKTPIELGRAVCVLHARFDLCRVGGMLGRDYVNVEVTSLRGSGNADGLPRGTQIVVTDIGHF
jgi:hypothetical protein